MVDGSQRIQIWKVVARDKSRGRCYGTGHLAANLGVSHLTREAEAPRNSEFENHIIEDARAEAAAARADAAAANGKAAKVETWVHNLEIKFEEFQRRMLALESGSCSVPSRLNSHPHYDADFDDQSIDEDA
ncbi:hypothetical protein A2U01_0021507 [Trifolium medium]|uniref:Uncharacterized protein n=1 Tax=Trifolium medium TaxID=97028 RepID=A0A392NKS3_9FABA|nr:hypothetical protein [Trifolium medium]